MFKKRLKSFLFCIVSRAHHTQLGCNIFTPQVLFSFLWKTQFASGLSVFSVFGIALKRVANTASQPAFKTENDECLQSNDHLPHSFQWHTLAPEECSAIAKDALRGEQIRRFAERAVEKFLRYSSRISFSLLRAASYCISKHCCYIATHYWKSALTCNNFWACSL
jgi:hypothetical protein